MPSDETLMQGYQATIHDKNARIRELEAELKAYEQTVRELRQGIRNIFSRTQEWAEWCDRVK